MVRPSAPARFERTCNSPRPAQARGPVRLSSHSLSLSFSWPHLVLERLRGCAAGPSRPP